MDYAIPIISVILAVLAASFAAKRRGRSGAWTAFIFIFPPLLLVLVCLPKTKDAKPTAWYGVVAEALGSIGIISIIGLVAYSAAEQGTVGGVPTCGSSLVTDTAKKAFENSPTGKLGGLAIIELDEIAEISETSLQRQCKGTALLNSTVSRQAFFDVTKRADKWFVTIRLSEE